jgi:hypothetical protein
LRDLGSPIRFPRASLLREELPLHRRSRMAGTAAIWHKRQADIGIHSASDSFRIAGNFPDRW